MLKIRPAALSDLDGIMEVERETFGDIGPGAAASRETMAARIALCNSGKTNWFWVAEYKGRVVGDIVLQPTGLSPDDCSSWGAATDDGTLRRTFDNAGENVYVVSLASSAVAPPGTSVLLAHIAFVRWLETGKKFFMFCSRVPGFNHFHKKEGTSIEEYWRLRHHDGGPRDAMLRLYWEMTGGAEPCRLLKDGFPPDADSGGHGVLFAADNPVAALTAVAVLIYQAGVATGK